MIRTVSGLARLAPAEPTPGGGPATTSPPPPGVDALTDQVLGWLRWGVLAAGVLGMLACVAMVLVGRRRRGGLVQDGLVGSLWVLTGLTLASLAALLVGAFAGVVAQ
jgi:hypothetical protein